MHRRRRVALLIESSRAYGRECLLGVASYLRSHGAWEITHYERGQTEGVPEAFGQWQGDGVIARVETKEVADVVASFGVPVVDLRGAFRPRVGAMLDTDHASTAHLAADHFLDIGFRQFAYCGYPGVEFSDFRQRAFAEYLAERGHTVHCYPGVAASGDQLRRPQSRVAIDHEKQGEREQGLLARWLRSLPGPVGVWACNDVRGRQVVDACTAIDLAVPEQVAVVGVDDDEVLCELSNPPLSSVKPDARGIGFRGAHLLTRMLDGESAPSGTVMVPALEVVRRMSSEATAVDDPAVAAAMRIIRDRACVGLSVEDVAAAVHTSRSTLERRFRHAFGRSPAAEIERLRMARAKLLLAETEDRMAKIAEKTGYRSAAQFITAFKRHTQQTPGQYRATAHV